MTDEGGLFEKINMAKNLLIVESPAKAKTIEAILGKDFEVKSCFGHIRDLQPALPQSSRYRGGRSSIRVDALLHV